LYILGVCNAGVSGATLLRGGRVIASVNEERYTRIKNHRTFPERSIRYCLKEAKIEVEDVDWVACGAWGGIDETYLPRFLADVTETIANNSLSRQLIVDRTRTAIQRDHGFRRELAEGLVGMGFRLSRTVYYDHHLSHAYTAFYPSHFDSALVLTMDGRGDFKSATISRASRQSGIELLDSTSMFDSLGFFYAFATRHLGFTPDRHEGKVTGLAAFGDPSVCTETLRRMIDYRGRIVANVGPCFSPFLTGRAPEIEDALAGRSREDVAAGAQHLLEEITIAYLREFLAQTKLRNVCLAGGVFGNVKLNQRILELDEVDDIYVFPQMGDGGNAFGGALIRLYELGESLEHPLQDVYLGPRYSDAEILAAVSAFADEVQSVPLERYTLTRIAREIAGGAVVGLFTGRMEYGPRALGARTVLARATEKNITAVLNRRLNRSEFMPFAPVTLEEEADTYYKGWRSEQLASRFMTVCYECTERANRETPGIVHVDNTARPQVIARAANPLYYDIVREYRGLTGIPTVINTSFNNHEEPIVCSPEDAIKSLLIDNVDYVVMESQVVSRKKQD
jgi:carbamoyltransferase